MKEDKLEKGEHPNNKKNKIKIKKNHLLREEINNFLEKFVVISFNSWKQSGVQPLVIL